MQRRSTVTRRLNLSEIFNPVKARYCYYGRFKCARCLEVSVKEDFDSVWNNATQARQERETHKKAKRVKNADDEKTDENDWRTCTVSLKQVLRKEKQYTLRQAELQLQKVDIVLDDAKKARNFWSRMLTGAKTIGKDKAGSVGHESQEYLTKTKPTWDRPCAEDTPSRLDLQELFAGHRTKTTTNRTRIVVPWAGDPGVKTLSENVFQTVEDIQKSVHRYHVLNDEVSFGRRQRRVRERLLKKDMYKAAKTGLESIARPEVSLTTATTMEQVDAAGMARTLVIKDIRLFHRDPLVCKVRQSTATARDAVGAG
ncbi:hypothetical protein BGZ67_008005 [Mortierella alpina]|nr:hypothetical protein BGZ67_008005 [Mortierella alpina]